MTENVLAGAAGVLLTLAFSYIPKLNTWYAKQPANTKRGVMALFLLVVAAGAYGLSCLGWLQILWPGMAVTCDQTGALELTRLFFVALIANQSTYPMLPQEKKVKALKEGRVQAAQG